MLVFFLAIRIVTGKASASEAAAFLRKIPFVRRQNSDKSGISEVTEQDLKTNTFDEVKSLNNTTATPSRTRGLFLVIGVALLLMVGVVYAWSILSAPLAGAYQWSSQELSLNYTVMMSSFCLSGIVGGVICTKLNSPKVSLLLSAVFTCFGFAATAYLTFGHILLLYLFYGVCVGCGAGFSYNAVVGSVSSWFPEKRGFASGVLLMGFGASTLVLGSLASAIIDGGVISWQMTFALFGVIAGIALLIGSLFLRFPKAEELQAFTVSAAASQNAPKNSLTTFEMLKTRAFWMVFIFAVFGSAIGSGVISHAKQIVLDCGVNAAIATLCVGILSVANGFGRVLFGMLYDRKGRSGAMYTAILFLVGAVVLLLFSLKAAATLPVIPGLLLVGMAYGAMPTTSAAFVAQQFGPKYYATNFSVMNLTLMVSSFTSVISSTLVASSGSYISSFYLYLVFCGVMLLISLLLNGRKAKQSV